MDREDQHILLDELMERSAPALNELVFEEVFGREEMNKIIKQRRDYEYKIFSASKTKDQYLKYLEFELNFVSLVQTRSHTKGKNFKLEHFNLLLQHVFSIFERALKKYKSDLILWKTYIDFAVKFNFRVDYVFERALKKNPSHVDLWILCAKWYYEFNSDNASARSKCATRFLKSDSNTKLFHFLYFYNIDMFRRAVKLNKSNASLWTEFFKLECIIAAPDPDEMSDETKPADAAQKEKSDDPFKIYDIPLLIYEEAKQHLPNEHEMRVNMVEILSHFPNVEKIQNKILQSILLDFQHNEQAVFAVQCYKLQQKLNYYGKLKIEQQEADAKKHKKSNDNDDEEKMAEDGENEDEAREATLKHVVHDIYEIEKETEECLFKCANTVRLLCSSCFLFTIFLFFNKISAHN